MSETAANTPKGKQAILYSGFLVLGIGLALFCREAALGLKLFEFGDETEKFVAAQMIDHGLRLYRDIFAHHGPVPYLIAHIYTLLVSRSDFTSIRMVEALLALLSALALYAAPVWRSAAARVWAVGGYLFLLSSVWLVQGMHLILYQQIGGFLFAIAFLHLFVPLFLDVAPNRYGVFASGVAVVAACFCAYAFGPSAVLLTLSSLVLLGAAGEGRRWKKTVPPFLLGLLSATAAIVLWLLLFADLQGFYVYHFYFNQHVYTLYFPFSPADVLRVFSFSLAPEAVIHTVVLSLAGLWLLFFAAASCGDTSGRGRVARILATALALASVAFLNPRGGNGFHDNAFIIVNFALFVVACGLVFQRALEQGAFLRAAGLLPCFFLPFLLLWLESYEVPSSPYAIKREEWHNHVYSLKPEEGGIYELIRSLTRKERDLLCLVFNPIHYLKADRLPASGHYYYLPWQAAYNWKPLAGYRIDICQDIHTQSPAVILFDNWKVRGFLPLESYQSCILANIRKNYVQLGPDSQLFVRKDLIVGEVGTDDARQIAPSPPLSGSAPIQLRMTSAHQRRHVGLRRIGILFGGAAPPSQGEAELRLQGPDGEALIQRFALADLPDNGYRYFDLDAKPFASGEIVSRSGGGITTLESRDGKGDVLTCITYEYADGKRGFTPGCPFF